MRPKVVSKIRACLREGQYSRKRVIALFCEEKYRPGELDPKAVEEAVDREIQNLRKEQRSWPKESDCDRLSRAFRALHSKGIIALENAGADQSDGYHAVRVAYDLSKRKACIVGYCFYHNQDLEDAVLGRGLYLAFGPLDPKKEETEGVKVGRLVVEELKRAGFSIKWNGTFKERVLVKKLDWKKRSSVI